jgi:hypothetical protein
MDETFELLGQGFDTVQLSFRVQIRPSLSEELRAAQLCAKETRNPEPVLLGPNAIRGEVLRHGGGGGDAIFSTGELDEIILVGGPRARGILVFQTGPKG